jgi:hypothetical protein
MKILLVVLKFDNSTDYRITAVIKDIPKASHFHLISISLYGRKNIIRICGSVIIFRPIFCLKRMLISAES